MNLPNEIWNKIEEKVNNSNLKNLSQSFRSISDKYMSKKYGKNLIENEDEALAYCISRMPATYCATYKVLNKSLEVLKENQVDEKIESVLDFGSGTGATTMAVLSLLTPSNINCIERERLMSSIAKELLEDYKNINWIDADVVELASKKDISILNADLVISSYMLNELSTDDVEKVVDYLWDKTNKILVLVDSGTPEDFSRIKRIREYLISKGGFIFAPCPHNLKCEILEDDWCAFSTRVERNRIQKEVKSGEVPYEDEKFTFLAIAKEDIASKIKERYPRILREPEVTKNYISMKICSEDGKIFKQKVIKTNKEQFKKAKKSENGDLF